MVLDEVVIEQQVVAVSSRFGFGTPERITRLRGGNVNDTFRVDTPKKIIVVQRLSPLFDAAVVEDYRTVSEHLHRKRCPAPVLLPNPQGEYAIAHEHHWWRAFTFIPHDDTIHPSPTSAQEAGYLLARYHLALSSLDYHPRHDMRWIHDTDTFYRKTEEGIRTTTNGVSERAERYLAVVGTYLQRWELPKNLPNIVIHGDPKIDNVFFRDGKAIAIGDLDNVMRAPKLIDIGDALRSWSARGVEFDRAVYDAAVRGYKSGDGPMPDPELLQRAAVHFTVELALRYLADAFEPEDKRFFTWDPSRYSSHAEHDLARCEERLRYAQNMIKEFRPQDLNITETTVL